MLPPLTLGRPIIARASSLGSQCTCVLTLGSSVNVHMHHSVAQHHHTCCIGSGFRLPWENMEELREQVDRKPQGQGMVPADSISDISVTKQP